jgi:molybdate transport system permease protein
VPGQTQTLPLAIFTALQTPGGEQAAAKLALISVILAVGGLLLGEWVGKRLRP